jgi:hypothetical protein
MKSTTRGIVGVVIASAVLVAAYSLSLWAQSQKSTKGAKETQSPAASSAPAKLQPLNIKPGLWETTVTSKMAGGMSVPAEMLNRLTAEHRARMEERIKAQSGQANTITHHSCITREQLQNPDFTDRKQCKWTTLESTSTRASGSATCQEFSGRGEIIVVDGEHTKGSLHLSANDGGMSGDTTFTSKWLRSDCGNER